MPRSTPSSLQKMLCPSSRQPEEVVIIIAPILQARKLRLREGRSLAQVGPVAEAALWAP